MTLLLEILAVAAFIAALFGLEWFLVWLVTPGNEIDGY
jgi:hypothetical protein